MRTCFSDSAVLVMIAVIGGGFLIIGICALVSHLLDRRRATRSQGRGAHSYGGYSGSGYYGSGGSGTGRGGGGVW